MSLKELSENKINIANLQPVETRKDSCRDAFERLKGTPFLKDSRWNSLISPDGYTEYAGSENLPLALAEALFYPEEGRMRFEEARPYHIKCWEFDESSLADARSHFVDEGLLLVLGESLLGSRDDAEEKYVKMKNNPKRYKDGQWIAWKEEKGYDIRTGDQLLGFIAEKTLYPERKEEIRGSFEKLRKDKFDETRMQWWDEGVDGRRDYLPLEEQMYGVIMEAVYDKNMAREIHEGLKSKFFSGEYWLKYEGSDKEFLLKSQLWPILAEKSLQENEFSMDEKVCPPEVRRF